MARFGRTGGGARRAGVVLCTAAFGLLPACAECDFVADCSDNVARNCRECSGNAWAPLICPAKGPAIDTEDCGEQGAVCRIERETAWCVREDLSCGAARSICVENQVASCVDGHPAVSATARDCGAGVCLELASGLADCFASAEPCAPESASRCSPDWRERWSCSSGFWKVSRACLEGTACRSDESGVAECR